MPNCSRLVRSAPTRCVLLLTKQQRSLAPSLFLQGYRGRVARSYHTTYTLRGLKENEVTVLSGLLKHVVFRAENIYQKIDVKNSSYINRYIGWARQLLKNLQRKNNEE